MKIYQFIKYNSFTAVRFIDTTYSPDVILCFDLEDSVQDIFDPQKTPALKIKARQTLRTLLEKLTDVSPFRKLGIRFNAIHSDEHVEDLKAFKNFFFQTIFLPKIKCADDVLYFEKKLKEHNISYERIVPVIESKTGMQSLEEIIHVENVKSLAFGHCDYNLDTGQFPFFHHNTREYWTWVETIISIISSSNVDFINSPFLELSNMVSFDEMLQRLSRIAGNGMGQITLTNKQTELCLNFKKNPSQKLKNIFPRLDIRFDRNLAINFIRQFEKENNNRPFTITQEDHHLLSPHEYVAAQNYLTRPIQSINLTFVGGCFPVQRNILFEDLFHQVLKRLMEKENNISLNIHIIRYEEFKTCNKKIAGYHEKNKIDILAFSLRPEPVLRLTKLIYKYKSSSGRIRRDINLPFLKNLRPENHDLLATEYHLPIVTKQTKSLLKRILINANYLLGMLIGNNSVALKKYVHLLNSICEFTKVNTIPLVVIGPPLRKQTSMEDILSKKLIEKTTKWVPPKNVAFINGSDRIKDGIDLFYAGGVYANEHYHAMIADRMHREFMNINAIREIINPLVAINL